MAPMFDLVERLISSSSDVSLVDQDLNEPISEPLSPINSMSSLQEGGIAFGDHLSPSRQRYHSEADSGLGSVCLAKKPSSNLSLINNVLYRLLNED